MKIFEKNPINFDKNKLYGNEEEEKLILPKQRMKLLNEVKDN